MEKFDFHQLTGKWLIRIMLNIPDKGTRFTPLQHSLAISPSRLSDNLDKLEKFNLINHLKPSERRHPLLAEYSFTTNGILIKNKLKNISRYESHFTFDIYEKWTLSVLLALTDNCQFNIVKKQLKITPKVLSNRLQKLIDLEIVIKEIDSLSPMFVKYSIAYEWQDVCSEIKDLL